MMKKLITADNILTLVQLIMTGIVMLIYLLYKPITGWDIAVMVTMAVIGIAIIRLAEPIAKLNNKISSISYRIYRAKQNQSVDDTPSEFAIVIFKIPGYMLFCIQLVFLFL